MQNCVTTIVVYNSSLLNTPELCKQGGKTCQWHYSVICYANIPGKYCDIVQDLGQKIVQCLLLTVLKICAQLTQEVF